MLVSTLFHGGSVISKRRLGQPGFSDLGLRCVGSTGFFISRLSGRLASNISSGDGEYSLFRGGSVISKRRLGQLAFQFWVCAVLSVLGSLFLAYQED